MSSLLDGIDVKDPSAEKPTSSGPNPKVIKGVIAGALFLVAGAFIGMQAGFIPSPFGGQVRNSQGEVVPPPAATTVSAAEQEKLRKQEEDFIKSGGEISGS